MDHTSRHPSFCKTVGEERERREKISKKLKSNQCVGRGPLIPL
jgi:hypothetical protein